MFYDNHAEYKSYLPEIFQEVVEINALDHTIKMQIDKLNTILRDSINNKSVQQANEDGVSRWEKILGVTTPLNATIVARKEALRSKLMTKPPINMITLKGIIEAYMGVIVDITIDEFVVKVRYRGTSRIEDLNPLYVTVYETIPANLILDIAYAFVTFAELDSLSLIFEQLDEKNLDWHEFERGEWI